MSRRSTLSTKPKPGHPFCLGRAAAVFGRTQRQNPFPRGDHRWHAQQAGYGSEYLPPEVAADLAEIARLTRRVRKTMQATWKPKSC